MPNNFVSTVTSIGRAAASLIARNERQSVDFQIGEFDYNLKNLDDARNTSGEASLQQLAELVKIAAPIFKGLSAKERRIFFPRLDTRRRIRSSRREPTLFPTFSLNDFARSGRLASAFSRMSGDTYNLEWQFQKRQDKRQKHLVVGESALIHEGRDIFRITMKEDGVGKVSSKVFSDSVINNYTFALSQMCHPDGQSSTHGIATFLTAGNITHLGSLTR